MRAHVVECHFLRVGAVLGGDVFEESVADTVIHPVGDVVQARGVAVDFSVAVAHLDDIVGKSAFGEYSINHRRQAFGQHVFHERGAVHFVGIDDETFFVVHFQGMSHIGYVQILNAVAHHQVAILLRIGGEYGCSGTECSEHQFSHCFHCFYFIYFFSNHYDFFTSTVDFVFLSLIALSAVK